MLAKVRHRTVFNTASVGKKMSNPGLNTESALARLMGNKSLYLKILERFRTDYPQFDIQISQLVQDGNLAEAALRLHGMKGVSGNLGAELLYEICQDMELLCKNAATLEKLQPHLADLSAELKLVLLQIQDGAGLN